MSLTLQNGEKFQPFPDDGPLAHNMNMELDTLSRIDKRQGIAYSYVVTTVSNRDGEFRQYGCGPNFQGGLLTICTCKGRMRTYPGVLRGTWIAGFTDRSERHG